MGAVLTGIGHFLPAGEVSSAALEARLGHPPGWIEQRVGIRSRHCAAADEPTWVLGTHAAQRALADAGMDASAVDLLIGHTSVAETSYPDVTWLLARDLGVPTTATVMGLRGACAGFLTALQTAAQFLETGAASCALVVCMERLHAPTQGYAVSAPLFGDGAAAAVLCAGPGGLRGVVLESDPAGMAHGVMVNGFLDPRAWGLVSPGLAATAPAPDGSGTHWSGRDIFESAVQGMAQVSERVLDRCGLALDDIDHFLFHQANARILKSLVRRLRLPEHAQVHQNIARVGNISSATVPCLLSEGRASGTIVRGDRVLMAAFGLGFTSGAAILEV